jgi:Tannase and feruloyl esterase
MSVRDLIAIDVHTHALGRRLIARCAALALLAAASTLAGAAAGEPATAAPASAPRSRADCEALLQPRSPLLTISTVQLVPAGPLVLPPAPGAPPIPPLQLPAHCLVQGALDPRTGVDGKHYAIGFQLRMPTQWNGRFVYQGGGGLDGFIAPALGSAGGSSPPALLRGFAVVTTDSGHEGRDASFAADQQARLDYAYAAIGTVSAAAKELIAQFYGQRPRYSYFVGCSNGGREGMMAAQRFPEDFDGVIAGDPGFHLSAAAIAEVWDTDQFYKVAPHDSQGRPILSESFTAAELQLVSRAVLRACDALDGLADGMINDTAACHFNPKVLQCSAGEQRDCLSSEKLAVLRAVFDGAHDSADHSLYSPWPYDAGLAGPGWRAWKLGTSRTAASNAINATLGANAMQMYFLTPPRPGMTDASFDFDRDPPAVAQTAAINDAVSTFMTSFAAHGGRLLIYQGMSDPVFSADDIIHYYRELTRDDGPPQAWARLFLVPGMNHCGGGPATDDFDALTAIQQWTEHGVAPDRLIAHGRAFPGITRPLCPYPKYAHYLGGDPHAAASFECKAP